MSEAVMGNDPVLTALSKIRRGRDRRLIGSLIRAVASKGGEYDVDACVTALAEAWEKPVSRASAKKIIDKKLNNPNIREAMRDIYRDLRDFGIEDAVDLHVQHMEGVEHDVVCTDKLGNRWVERVQDKPNYSALKDFLQMTVPMPEKKISLTHNLGNVGPSMLQNVPDIAPRAIGPAVVEEVIPHDVQFDEEPGDDQG